MKYLIILALAMSSLNGTMNEDSKERDVLAWFYQMVLEAKAKPMTTNPEQRARYRSWDMLCFELRDVDCTGLKVPKVMKFEPNPLRPGLAGYYKGGDTIYIRDNIRGMQREEVLAHEMSHYIDVKHGLANVPGFAREICFSEKRAWAVSDNFWLKYGWDERTVGTTWTEWYTHCTPLQSELYPDVYGE